MTRRSTRKRAHSDTIESHTPTGSEDEAATNNTNSNSVARTVPNAVTPPPASNKRSRISNSIDVVAAVDGNSASTMDIDKVPVELNQEPRVSTVVDNRDALATVTEMECDVQTDDENNSDIGSDHVDTPTKSPTSHVTNHITPVTEQHHQGITVSREGYDLSSPNISLVLPPTPAARTCVPKSTDQAPELQQTSQSNETDKEEMDFVVIDKKTLSAATSSDIGMERLRFTSIRSLAFLVAIATMILSFGFYSSSSIRATPQQPIEVIDVETNTSSNIVSEIFTNLDIVAKQISEVNASKFDATVDQQPIPLENNTVNYSSNLSTTQPFDETVYDIEFPGEKVNDLIDILKNEDAVPSETVEKETSHQKLDSEIPHAPTTPIMDKALRKPFSSIYFVPGYQFILR